MTHPSLKNLLKDGTFGGVIFGMTEDQVLEHLGKPDFTGGGTRETRDNIWRYGDLELGFSPKEYTLFHIGINFWNEKRDPEQGKALTYDPWSIRGGKDLMSFLNDCEADQIDIFELDPPLNEGCREFVTLTGSHLIFVAENDFGEDVIGLTKMVCSMAKFPTPQTSPSDS